jgi:hypothetical protein
VRSRAVLQPHKPRPWTQPTHRPSNSARRRTRPSIRAQTQKNNTEPTGFRAAVGAAVPEAIELAPVPATIANLMPQTKGLESTMVEGQVVLVEPKSKQIVAVIVSEP